MRQQGSFWWGFAVLCSGRYQTVESVSLCCALTSSLVKLRLPDDHPNTVNAPWDKRAEIVGDIELHSREIERLRAEFVHLDVVAG
jgi:hypothetical protein